MRDAGAYCQLCPAWLGTLGLEPTLDCAGWATGEPCGQCYVCHLAEVFDGVWRILRDDGLCFVNLGDSYATRFFSHDSLRTVPVTDGDWSQVGQRGVHGTYQPPASFGNLKPKDLCGQPWRVAFALQARGWYLRSAPPWIKGNPMPESATDRPGVSHEMWFMLSKRARYFWDGEAVRVSHKEPWRSRDKAEYAESHGPKERQGMANMMAMTRHRQYHPTGRNLRTADFFRQGLTDLITETEAYLAHLKHIDATGGLLTDPEGTPAALVFNSTAYSGAHFATFSPAMIRPLIQGGTSERGCCPGCGAGWEREIAKASVPLSEFTNTQAPTDGFIRSTSHVDGVRYGMGQKVQAWRNAHPSTTLAWLPTCPCYWQALEAYQATLDDTFARLPRTWEAWQSVLHAALDAMQTTPCVVLDPFGGAGSVALEADRLGRSAILCEAQPGYVEMARERLQADAPLLAVVALPGAQAELEVWEQLPLL